MIHRCEQGGVKAVAASELFFAEQSTSNLSLHMQTEMMVYNCIVTELNIARLRGTSFPIVHSLIEASLAVASNVSSFACSILHLLKYFLAQLQAIQMTQNFHIKNN